MNINAAEKRAITALRNRNERGASDAGDIFAVLVVLVLIVAVKGWALMLAWGIIAAILGVATIAFWPAVAVAALLSLALGTSVAS